ncbi:MAG: tetratricopeptide repeat protein [Bacteroidota bacterium]
MKARLTLLISALLCFTILDAQEDKKLDSLLSVYATQSDDTTKVKTLHQLFIHLRHKDARQAFTYNKESLSLSKKLGYPLGEGTAYLNLAYYYRFLPNVDSARFYFEKSVRILKKNTEKERWWFTLNEYATFETLQGNFNKALSLADDGMQIASELKSGTRLIDNLQRKSTIYMDTGDFKMAMETALEASRIIDTLVVQNPKRKAIALADIGRIEMLRGNYERSLEPMQESLGIFEKLNDEVWIATVLIEIGNLYWYLKDYDNSQKKYEESLEISYRMKRDDFVAANLANLGLILQDKKQYGKAIEYLEKGNTIARKIGSINNVIINHNDLGTAYFSNRDYLSSIKNHSVAIRLADSIAALDILADGYFGRSRAYEGSGDYAKALLDQREFQKIRDSVFNENKSRQIEELKTQYETEKKEQQIVLQEKDIAVLEKEAQISYQQKLLLGGGLGFSLVALGLGFYGFRQKIKRNRLEKEKINAELAFKRKELTTHALQLAKKNETLEGLKQKANALKEADSGNTGYQQLIRAINFDLQDDNNWENFARYFEEVHKDFNSKVKTKYPQVTSNELRLLALLKMNLSSKEIANILNISLDGIKKARYRLRKKLDITTEDSLQDLVLSL